MVYQELCETNLLQLIAKPESTEWFSTLSVFIFEVSIDAEQKQA